MCWRTCFLRRMESLAKGIHYNICACARKETTEGWKKTRRYGKALHNTRILTCPTSGSWHVWHPGLGMFDIRVSVCTTPGCRTQEKGLREKWHRKKTIQKHATRKKKWILCLKSISIHCFCAADQSSIFLNSIFHLFTLIIHLLPTLYTINSITLSISLDSFCTMEPSYNLPG